MPWNPLNWLTASEPRPGTARKRRADEDVQGRARYRRPSDYPAPRYPRADYENAEFIPNTTKRRHIAQTLTTTLPPADNMPSSSIKGRVKPKERAQSRSLPKTASPRSVRLKRELYRLRGLAKNAPFDLEIAAQIRSVEEELQRIKQDEVRATPNDGTHGVSGIQEIQPPEEDLPEEVSEPNIHILRQRTEPDHPATENVPEIWVTDPVKAAWDLVNVFGHDTAAVSGEIRSILHEPDYSVQDVEIRDTLWDIMTKMENLAKTFFSFDFGSPTALVKQFAKLKPETAKIIGCVANGGPSGQHGWHDLFYNKQKRHALVCAIIGNVLVEQVFQHWLFGGDEALKKQLESLQHKYRHEDGFFRNTKTAQLIRSNLFSPSDATLHLPPNFESHTHSILLALHTHLAPILALAPSSPTPTYPKLLSALHAIVVPAAILSLIMRADPKTVYYFTPTFKDQPYDDNHMECFNRAAMEKSNPRQRTEWPRGVTQREMARAQNDDALTQIVLMDGVTAYRQGGWEHLHDAELEDEGGGGEVEENEVRSVRRQGIRARALTQGWVLCRWGRQRKFKNGVKADVEADHGQFWRGGGFVEFRDVVAELQGEVDDDDDDDDDEEEEEEEEEERKRKRKVRRTA